MRSLTEYRLSPLLRAEFAPEVLASARQQSTIGGIEAALASQFPAEVVLPMLLRLV
ncbi:hypothetical protein [Streptomyces specialis]|uniref:hypothetical protein n=1 Tax=Streptomyces specialis TaxID=498367 RepID=UPI000AFB6019|nr:hypothetical protein [Streptomyces specialis]